MDYALMREKSVTEKLEALSAILYQTVSCAVYDRSDRFFALRKRGVPGPLHIQGRVEGIYIIKERRLGLIEKYLKHRDCRDICFEKYDDFVDIDREDDFVREVMAYFGKTDGTAALRLINAIDMAVHGCDQETLYLDPGKSTYVDIFQELNNTWPGTDWRASSEDEQAEWLPVLETARRYRVTGIFI